MNFGFTQLGREDRKRWQVAVHVTTCLLGMAAMLQATSTSAQPVDVSACGMPRGAALAPEKDRQRALEACSRVIGDAALPAAVRSDAMLTRGEIYSLLSAIDLKTAVEIDPANSALRKRRGHYYSVRGWWLEQAIADYNEAIRLDPNDADAYRERGDVRLRQKRIHEAIADYRKAIELKPVDASRAWGLCNASASNPFFYCIQVADDMGQPAENRAQAQRRLDDWIGRYAPAR
jgi:tetratricopeptide (TPR) repeat protein